MSGERIEIDAFTDPVCEWCWGNEPVLRKLETYYKDQIEIVFVMGGLIEDIRNFWDGYVGGDPEESNRNTVHRWLEASARHGMPVEEKGFQLFTEENPSSWPMNIAYKAAQFEDNALADKFLRRMREATHAEAIPANRPEKLIELAQQTGLDVSQFIQHFTDGSANDAFEHDLFITQALNVTGFPSFLIHYGEKKVMLRGYQSFAHFKSVITFLSNGEIQGNLVESIDQNILGFIQKYGRVAPVEIKESFDLDDTQLAAKFKSLQAQNLITVNPAGNGHFITLRKPTMSCDPHAGICDA